MTLSNKVFTLAAASLLTIAAYAQAPSSWSRELMTMAELDSALSRDISLSSGNYALYDSRPLLLSRTKKALDGGTPAPKGYKPVYISTLVRHGARYCIGDGYHSRLMNFLTEAKDSAQLTAKGEEFLRRYSKIFPLIDGREGELTQVGYRQHQEIAKWLYESYPEVFKGKTRAKAMSTNVLRTAMSMQAEVSELSSLDPDLSLEAEASRTLVRLLDPSTGAALPKPVRVKISPEGRFTLDSLEKSLGEDKISICAEFLKDPLFAHRRFKSGRSGFSSAMRHIIIDAPCMDMKPDFSSFMSDSQLSAMYKIYVYNGYLNYGLSPQSDKAVALSTYSLLKNFIACADEDLKDGTALRLRFGHDTGLMPLLSLMGVNNFGISSSDPSVVIPNWTVYDIPMACNFVLVFYRPNNGGGDTLVKVMLNGKEASLPVESVSGPYYSWNKLREYYSEVADKAEAEFERL